MELNSAGLNLFKRGIDRSSEGDSAGYDGLVSIFIVTRVSLWLEQFPEEGNFGGMSASPPDPSSVASPVRCSLAVESVSGHCYCDPRNPDTVITYTVDSVLIVVSLFRAYHDYFRSQGKWMSDHNIVCFLLGPRSLDVRSSVAE